MLYLQRCGEVITDSDFGHSACHTGMAYVYGTNEKIDVSGGWHDAGDYGDILFRQLKLLPTFFTLMKQILSFTVIILVYLKVETAFLIFLMRHVMSLNG